MSDATRDRIEGALGEATGSGKSALGDLTGDEGTQAEGEKDQATGNAKQGMADVKDKVDDVVKKVTDRS
ncbi:MAG: CsbD family protein [Chloroflexota bacterium]|nr:CsbD family protein [Chloroflexota bacterium]